eukprot:gnl/TRDRNA2_/TRDRNA2_194315_c0_seq1.p1 gnl/TRDRNA2_/TRDRNA2_194315_c0~~gnl/TRDRNA2_/TRDRNA2_194315_c0_seq1.p1  ORF type:complete len:199 (+),score=36.28 gnl/TRDRNA2_/TRDRNA2_194315_c0_seq1:41-598(+)
MAHTGTTAGNLEGLWRTAEDFLQQAGHASTELHSALFNIKESGFCCTGLGAASSKAYIEADAASKALSAAEHTATGTVDVVPTGKASKKIKKAIDKLWPITDFDDKEHLLEEGPLTEVDAPELQSAVRRSTESAPVNGSSMLPLLPAALSRWWIVSKRSPAGSSSQVGRCSTGCAGPPRGSLDFL